ncbi:hypothetical protein J437_LFUL009184 [Ladona fulva]|uniref:Uncharacterized protein n=1 Tax=Ladona fulva TaxID=123851 RepID=A0A8K0NU02_LADFU|nr:hypothetical protein J437_LFUL009184 [Ladona fulva]
MSFLPVYLGSLITLLCFTSASDVPVSVGEKESNVSSVTSVFLPPSLSTEHLKEASKTLSDEPVSIKYHQMDEPSKLLASLQADYEKLMKEVEERKATYSQARKEFDLKKEGDEKELAKMDGAVKEREEVEEKLKQEKARLDEIRTNVDKEEAALRAEEEKVADLQRRKEEVDRKDEELKSLSTKLIQLEKDVEKTLGKCIEVPQALIIFWGTPVHPDTRLCIKTS